MTCCEVREYLFAFLDSELDAPLSIELQRHIEHCPACAREVEIERTVRRHLAMGLERQGPINALDEEFLRKQLVSASGERESEKRFAWGLRRWRLAATSVAAVLILGVVAWLSNGRDDPRPNANHFADRIVADFERFVADGTPVQFASTDAAAVSAWLLDQTGIAVLLPDATPDDCRLVGARSCEIAGRSAAFVLYRLDGVPSTLIVINGRGIDLGQMAQVEHEGRTYWVDRCQRHTVLACRRGEQLYAAVSTLPEPQLVCLTTGLKHEGN